MKFTSKLDMAKFITNLMHGGEAGEPSMIELAWIDRIEQYKLAPETLYEDARSRGELSGLEPEIKPWCDLDRDQKFVFFAFVTLVNAGLPLIELPEEQPAEPKPSGMETITEESNRGTIYEQESFVKAKPDPLPDSLINVYAAPGEVLSVTLSKPLPGWLPATYQETIDAILDAARAAHEANMRYCETIGDLSQVWDDAPTSQKQSIINGVVFAIENDFPSPEAMHANWLAEKLAQGWVHGAVKDVEKKTHPCILPYDQLPAEQRHKDTLFRDTIMNVLTAPEQAKPVNDLPADPADVTENTDQAADIPVPEVPASDGKTFVAETFKGGHADVVDDDGDDDDDGTVATVG